MKVPEDNAISPKGTSVTPALPSLAGTLLLLLAVINGAAASEAKPPLRVYGPGGPHLAMEEAAELFRERRGIEVAVIKALPHELDERLRDDGDIYYGGAECMLEEFDRRNPGVLDMDSVVRLQPRRVGIIVRKGNPLGIAGIEDLARRQVRLLDVKLENMRRFHGNTGGLSRNIRRFVYTGRQGLDAWRTSPDIDAWVTYKTWHVPLEAEADFIEILDDQGLRYTPVALAQGTSRRDEALAFIAFLKSPEGREIFSRHGWD